MGSFVKKLKEKAKSFGEKVQDTGKTVVRKVARVGSVVAPIVGGALFGPVGAAAGGVIGAGLSQVGPNKNRMESLKRVAMATAGSVAISGALAAITGSGLTGSPLASIFGGAVRGPGPQPATSGGSSFIGYDAMGNPLFKGQESLLVHKAAEGGGGTGDALANAVLSNIFGGDSKMPAAAGQGGGGGGGQAPSNGDAMNYVNPADYATSPDTPATPAAGTEGTGAGGLILLGIILLTKKK